MNKEMANVETATGLGDDLRAMMRRTGLTGDEASIELSRRRTGLSFQRTRMSADRTLMSVMRTALSLIGFGFTIFQFFRSLRETDVGAQIVPVNAARNFGLSLVLLGVGMLIIGIWYHLRFMSELRRERTAMIEQGLVHGQITLPDLAHADRGRDSAADRPGRHLRDGDAGGPVSLSGSKRDLGEKGVVMNLATIFGLAIQVSIFLTVLGFGLDRTASGLSAMTASPTRPLKEKFPGGAGSSSGDRKAP